MKFLIKKQKTFSPLVLILSLVLLGLSSSFFASPVSAQITELEILGTYTGEEVAFGLFPSSMSAGDINGDGYEDFVFSSGTYNSQQGRVYVFFGDGNLSDHNAVDANLIINGEGGEFGISVDVGNFNGDDYDDILITAHGYGSSRGRAYIFYGRSDFSATEIEATEADVIYTGEIISDSLGYDATVGDVNNDGYDDAIIGAYAYSGNSRKGAVYIFYGSEDMTSKIATAEGSDVMFIGENNLDRFGITVTSGNINGDDYDDIIVGAYSYPANAGKGAIYIFYGGANLQDVNLSSGGLPDVVVIGSANGDMIGMEKPNLKGDFNTDGYDDLTFSYGNKVCIIQGRTPMPNMNLSVDNPDFTFLKLNSGTAEISWLDLNNDGYDDFVTADYGYNSNSGRVYVLFGNSFANGELDSIADVIIDGGASEFFGYLGELGRIGIYSTSDLDRNGWKEFIVPVLGFNSWTTGQVRLYSLNYALPTITNNLVSEYTNDNTPEITGLATEEGVNVSGVQWSFATSYEASGWEDCTASDGAFDSSTEEYRCNISDELTDGEHTVYVRSYDENNVYIPSVLFASTTFTIDSVKPTGTISINTNSTYTNTQSVTLALSANDNLSGVSQMMISNTSDFTGASWETYATTKSWTLPSGDGEKGVYVKYKDNAGNESTVVTDTIILKTSTILTLDLSLLDYEETEEVYTKTEGEEVIVKGTAEQSTKVTITALTEEGAIVYEAELTVGADGNWELNLGDVLGVGTYLVQISTIDPAGNVAYSEFTLEITEAEVIPEVEIAEPLPLTGEHILVQLLIGGMILLSSGVGLRKSRYKVGTK